MEEKPLLLALHNLERTKFHPQTPSSGLDTERINEVIKRASEGSRFYQHKQKHQQQLNEKLEQMKKEAASFTEEQIRRATKQVFKRLGLHEFAGTSYCLPQGYLFCLSIYYTYMYLKLYNMITHQ